MYTIRYDPGDSTSDIFGGNSNWRGPVWMPINFLIIQSIRHYGEFYGDNLMVEYPTGSGNMMNLCQVADELTRRVISLFEKDERETEGFMENTIGFINSRAMNTGVILRIFSWRSRKGTRRKSSNRVDGTGCRIDQ